MMNTPSAPATLFDIVTSMATILSFIAVAFSAATLRFHIDEEKIRKEENISSLFRSPIPPEHVLTPTGIRRAKFGKISLIVLALAVALVVVRNLYLSR